MSPRLFDDLLDASRVLREQRRERVNLIRDVLKGGRRTEPVIDVRSIRALTGLSQSRFAELLGIEAATLRNWEQGRRTPTGPARALLRAIRNNPIEVVKALNS